jgi:predicted Zn finger-like uncharacterized protein
VKLECEACRALVMVDTFQLRGDGIEVTCPACAVSFYIASRAAPPATLPDGPMQCPKCGTAQPEAEACRTCGLEATRFADFRASAADGADELDALWEATLAEWDDADRHRRFVEAASATDSFAVAARRYREVLRERPGDARADAALKRITRMAEAAMMVRAAARPAEAEGKEPYKNVLILLIALVMLAGAGGLYVMVRSIAQEEPTQVPVPGVERR